MAENGARDALIRAAGGVVWRPANDTDGSGIEIAIIHRPKYDDWTFPKGKLTDGETDLEGAVREVFEETGQQVRPGRALGEVRYMKDNGGPREKVVCYWSMQAVGGAFSPNREVDELRWVTPDAAVEVLTRDTDREVLVRFMSDPPRMVR
jgi:8-oxo-dGTP pyrophosphatase MutT (NUDIX family)